MTPWMRAATTISEKAKTRRCPLTQMLVIERSVGWAVRFRHFSRDYERLGPLWRASVACSAHSSSKVHDRL